MKVEEIEQLRAALEMNEALRVKLLAENQALRAQLAPRYVGARPELAAPYGKEEHHA